MHVNLLKLLPSRGFLSVEKGNELNRSGLYGPDDYLSLLMTAQPLYMHGFVALAMVEMTTRPC